MTGSSEDQKRQLLTRLLQERLVRRRDTKAENATYFGPPIAPVSRTGDLELSFGQEMVWLLEQMFPEALLYNIVERFAIKGRLDVELLRRSFDVVIERHEVLRTVYPVKDGQPYQKIEPPTPCQLQVIDLRAVPEQIRDDEARRLIVANVRKPFDLTAGPVLRPMLVQMTDDEHVLAVIMHHIAMDGWSLKLLIHELAVTYTALAQGRAPELPLLAVQYADFAHWQRLTMTGEALGTHRDYWLEKLGKSPPTLNLPVDCAASRIRSFDSDAYKSVIPSAVLDGLREISQQQGATLFTVLLAAYSTLLMRYSGQNDFIVGGVISGRSRPEVENLVGCFINSLALRMNLSGNPTFLELVARARDLVFGAHEHGVFQFHKLVEAMQPKRSMASNPFAQVFLNMLNLWDREEVSVPGLSISYLGGLDLHMPVDVLTLFAAVNRGNLELMYVYSTELFKPATIERMADDLKNIIECAVRAPETRVGDFSVSGPSMTSNSNEKSIAQNGGGNTDQLLKHLGELGVRLSLENGRVKVNAPKGVLTEAVKATIAARRQEILEALSIQSAPQETTERKLQRASREPPLPLSATQRRFWFLDRIGQGEGIPNVGFTLRLEGPFDAAALSKVMGIILERHESLLIRIGDRAGEPYPEIAAPTEDLVKTVDLSDLPETEREAEGIRLSQDLMGFKFDLADGALVRALIIRLSPDLNLLAISMHHIVGDGWSSSIVMREMEAAYKALVSGTGPDLPPVSFQYIDYAAWEAAQVRNGLFNRQLAYWTKTLAHAPAVLELPTDRPRPPVKSYRGSRFDCRIESDFVQRLQEFSLQNETTLFMTVLAAWAVVLHRLSGQDDLVIGTPVANRNNPDLERIVGPFINSLALRFDLAANPSFAQFLEQVRRRSIDAIENSELPFDMVVEAVNPTRTLNHSPIFQVMFGLHNFPGQPPKFEGLNCSFVKLDTHVARFDLVLDMAVYQGTLFGAYEYDTDLFDPATIERMHQQLLQVLEAILIDKTKSIDELPLRSATEDASLDYWNDTTMDYDRGLCTHQLFENTARLLPDAPAIIAGDETLSYADVEQRANALTHILQRHGVGRGSLVAICLDRSVDLPIAMIAVLKAGAAYVPLDPTHPSDRLHYTLEDAGVRCILTARQFSKVLERPGISQIHVDEIAPELKILDVAPPKVAVQPNDLAYVIYTSGSTGRPKGVQVEHGNLVNFLNAMRREPGFDRKDVLLAITTPSFDIAGLEIWLPLCIGGKLVMASREDVLVGERLIALLNQHPITVMQATPSTWRLMLAAGWTGKLGLKALCGGEALPRDLAVALAARVHQLWNMYGPTETTIWSTISLVANPLAAITIGRPIGNTRVYILEPSGSLAPIGAFGELAIAGEGVARGYWNRPELTAEKFVMLTLPNGRVERVYRTGDVARFRNDGQLEFSGRRDHQVKLRGYRIELGEVELVLAGHSGVKQCVVTIRGQEADTELIAYVVPLTGTVFDPDAARSALRGKLPTYMVPSQFVVLPSLPLTANGKIDRKALPAPEKLIEPVVNDDTISLMTPVQRRVADIWRKILRTNRVSLYDNFFDVGGHSMLVVKLHDTLKREFDSGLILMELFQHTTIASQAERVSSAVVSDHMLNRAKARARKRLHD